MEPQFWINSWERGGSCTSFHRPDIHPYVVKYVTPGLLAGKRVLVPLCGKTVDCSGSGSTPPTSSASSSASWRCASSSTSRGSGYVRNHDRFEADRLTLICRDIFTLSPDDLGPIDFVYDRAALVALPLPMRLRYVAKIDELTTCGAVQFVNTVQYDPVLDTPPFSIGPDDIERYHGGRYLIEHVECAVRPNHGMVRKFNLDWLVEHGFWLRRISR